MRCRSIRSCSPRLLKRTPRGRARGTEIRATATSADPNCSAFGSSSQDVRGLGKRVGLVCRVVPNMSGIPVSARSPSCRLRHRATGSTPARRCGSWPSPMNDVKVGPGVQLRLWRRIDASITPFAVSIEVRPSSVILRDRRQAPTCAPTSAMRRRRLDRQRRCGCAIARSSTVDYPSLRSDKNTSTSRSFVIDGPQSVAPAFMPPSWIAGVAQVPKVHGGASSAVSARYRYQAHTVAGSADRRTASARIR